MTVLVGLGYGEGWGGHGWWADLGLGVTGPSSSVGVDDVWGEGPHRCVWGWSSSPQPSPYVPEERCGGRVVLEVRVDSGGESPESRSGSLRGRGKRRGWVDVGFRSFCVEFVW